MKFQKPKKFKNLEHVVTVNNVYIGMRVKRGPDWDWNNTQDRNGTLTGKVINTILPQNVLPYLPDYDNSIWVYVCWGGNDEEVINEFNCFYYRVGPNKFDLYEVI